MTRPPTLASLRRDYDSAMRWLASATDIGDRECMASFSARARQARAQIAAIEALAAEAGKVDAT